MEGRQWAEYGKSTKPISKNQLASRVRRFKADPECKVPIEPSTVWIGAHSKKGYHRQQFEAAWQRYLAQTSIDPPFETSDRQTPHEMGTSDTFQGVRAEIDLTFRKCEKPASNGHSDARTFQNPPIPDDDDIPAFLNRRHEICDYCGDPGGAECAYGGVTVLLHSKCQRAWIDAHEASRNGQTTVSGSSA